MKKIFSLLFVNLIFLLNFKSTINSVQSTKGQLPVGHDAVQMTYDTINMPSYFYYNKTHFGNNISYGDEYGSCTIVSSLLVLSYYDAVFNDDIIPEKYDMSGSIGETADSQVSPGIIFDNYNEFQDVNQTVENLKKERFFAYTEIKNKKTKANFKLAGEQLLNCFDYLDTLKDFDSNLNYDESFETLIKVSYNDEFIKNNTKYVYDLYYNAACYLYSFDFTNILYNYTKISFENTKDTSLHSKYALKILNGEWLTTEAVSKTFSDVLMNESSLKTSNYSMNSFSSFSYNQIKTELENNRPVIAYIKSSATNNLHSVVIYDAIDETHFVVHYGWEDYSAVKININDITNIITFNPNFGQKKSNNYIINDGISKTYCNCTYNHVYRYITTEGLYDKIECIACHQFDLHAHICNRKTGKCTICGVTINDKIAVIESLPQYNYFE